MGGCVGTRRDGGSPSGDSSDMPAIGRNHPLKSEKPKWKSDVPLTNGQLLSKRDEFWDTAPAFEGRKEIWDALKAAAYALETGDFTLGQAIINGASISLPNGTLIDSYDELGNRYQLPVYVLSAPTNMIKDPSESESTNEMDDSPGAEIMVKFRLSDTNEDIKLSIRTTDTVLKVKKLIYQKENIEPERQRWFYSGQILNDKMRISDAKLLKGHLIQVIVSSKELSSTGS